MLAPQFIAQFAPAVGHEDVGIFVSQSGETKDVLNALEAAEARGMECFGLANVVGSTLTKATSFCLPLCCGYEISVPATKTFTNQVITFLYLAYRMAGKNTKELESIPALMEKTLEMVAPQVEAIAEDINEWNDMYCLGYGADPAHRARRRAEAQRDHLCALRRHALDRVQTRAALGGQQGLPDHLRGRAAGYQL